MRAGVIMAGAACVFWAVATMGAQGAELHPPRGEVLFENRCARCHGLGGDGGEGNAPPLGGILGRSVASERYYIYSDALKARGGVWTRDLLDHYIADPQAFAPGADMEINSPDPAEREAIIDYLTTLK